MGEFTETLGSILSRLAEWLGLKSSEARRFELMREKLTAARAGNVDRLEALKEKIQRLQARALQKKKEHDEARGDIKRIVAGEIERALREIDRLRGLETIITSAIERKSVAIVKIEELEAAQAEGVEEGDLDDLALELQEAFDKMRADDKAIKDLEREQYKPPEVEPVDIEGRLAEVEGSKERTGELSEKTRERLKQLEAEKE